ncbi:MAG TPA: Mov34/MPN/PAD-1 family protein [Actinomycetota bacterium]|nr:Mov34/MPN/PAD-1 family protein [Actinomycetota bacterium]
MNRRAQSYPGVGAAIFIPAEAWERTLAVVRTYQRESSEALVFWGGMVTGEAVQVTGVYVVGHDPQGGTVRPTPSETRWLVRRLRERDEKLVAQVHSHGGSAFHSSGDDERAASFHPGYLSVVVPRFGRGVRDLQDCAVLEFDGGGFRGMGVEEAARRVRVLPLVDERPGGFRARRRRKRGWITSIASSLRARLTGPRRHSGP